MLKIRDHADYKALENIGLVEPDDPAKALELGFPSRSAAKYDFMAENDPVPMPLADFAGLTENVINETNSKVVFFRYQWKTFSFLSQTYDFMLPPFFQNLFFAMMCT